MTTVEITEQTETNGTPTRARKAREAKPLSTADQFEQLKRSMLAELEDHERQAARIREVLGLGTPGGMLAATALAPSGAATGAPARPKAPRRATSRPASAKPVGAPRGPRANALPARILACLEGAHDGCTLSAIADATSAKAPAVNSALARLQAQGSVTRTGERGSYIYAASMAKSGE